MSSPPGRASADLSEVAGARIRLVREDDADEFGAVLAANREFLAPWDPARDDAFFTPDGHRQVLIEHLDAYVRGGLLPYAIELDGRIVGRINLTHIVYSAFQSADVGYWIAQDSNGRGLATAAVRAVLRVAFDDLGLHRVQAGTLLNNHASQRVLARNGFERIGLAPAYLNIGGRWQDHLLFQRLTDV